MDRRALAGRLQRLPGGFKVIDAMGQSLAYFYARDSDHDANTAGVLTLDEARRMASWLRPSLRGCQQKANAARLER
jgi:hypothetical protein